MKTQNIERCYRTENILFADRNAPSALIDPRSAATVFYCGVLTGRKTPSYLLTYLL